MTLTKREKELQTIAADEAAKYGGKIDSIERTGGGHVRIIASSSTRKAIVIAAFSPRGVQEGVVRRHIRNQLRGDTSENQ